MVISLPLSCFSPRFISTDRPRDEEEDQEAEGAAEDDAETTYLPKRRMSLSTMMRDLEDWLVQPGDHDQAHSHMNDNVFKQDDHHHDHHDHHDHHHDHHHDKLIPIPAKPPRIDSAIITIQPLVWERRYASDEEFASDAESHEFPLDDDDDDLSTHRQSKLSVNTDLLDHDDDVSIYDATLASSPKQLARQQCEIARAVTLRGCPAPPRVIVIVRRPATATATLTAVTVTSRSRSRQARRSGIIGEPQIVGPDLDPRNINFSRTFTRSPSPSPSLSRSSSPASSRSSSVVRPAVTSTDPATAPRIRRRPLASTLPPRGLLLPTIGEPFPSSSSSSSPSTLECHRTPAEPPPSPQHQHHHQPQSQSRPRTISIRPLAIRRKSLDHSTATTTTVPPGFHLFLQHSPPSRASPPINLPRSPSPPYTPFHTVLSHALFFFPGAAHRRNCQRHAAPAADVATTATAAASAPAMAAAALAVGTAASPQESLRELRLVDVDVFGVVVGIAGGVGVGVVDGEEGFGGVLICRDGVCWDWDVFCPFFLLCQGRDQVLEWNRSDRTWVNWSSKGVGRTALAVAVGVMALGFRGGGINRIVPGLTTGLGRSSASSKFHLHVHFHLPLSRRVVVSLPSILQKDAPPRLLSMYKPKANRTVGPYSPPPRLIAFGDANHTPPQILKAFTTAGRRTTTGLVRVASFTGAWLGLHARSVFARTLSMESAERRRTLCRPRGHD